MWHDIMIIVIGWAIPLIGAWLISKIPPVTTLILEHQNATIISLSFLISVLIAITAFTIYDRYILSNGVVVFIQQTGQCPPGYEDQGLILLGREPGFKDWYLKAELHGKGGFFPGYPTWPLDNPRLCVKK